MIRRILVIGGLGLGVAIGARFVANELGSELTARRWERREAQLLDMALFPPMERRPWEVRFESLAERVRNSSRYHEIMASSHRPTVHRGTDAPRPLDGPERLWLESLWNELVGLDAVLEALRRLPPEDLEWHGETARLSFLRDVTSALCGRAFLAIESGNVETMALAYADALRLLRATSDGTVMGTEIQRLGEETVLRSVRSALALGASATALRGALSPVLEEWRYDAARVERVIRRDLGVLAKLEPNEEPWDDPAWKLRYFEPVERTGRYTAIT